MKKLRIGTFNTGDFSGDGVPAGSERARELFRDVIENNGVDIWGLQEDVGFFNKESGEMPYDAVYSSYKNYERFGEKKYNYKAILTNLPIGGAERIYYEGECKFRHPWFLHAQVDVDGKDVCVISLHFDWYDIETRRKQIKQVVDFASKYEYVMILGDFNPNDYINGERQSNNSTHERDLDLFRAAGYSVANADRFGIFSTICDIGERISPCDNIVVSPNIKILDVGSVRHGWMFDHAALWADIEI